MTIYIVGPMSTDPTYLTTDLCPRNDYTFDFTFSKDPEHSRNYTKMMNCLYT